MLASVITCPFHHISLLSFLGKKNRLMTSCYLCVSAYPSIQLLKQLSNFQEILNEYYATGGHPKVQPFNSLLSVRATWQTSESYLLQ
jgi:hypothetical protein